VLSLVQHATVPLPQLQDGIVACLAGTLPAEQVRLDIRRVTAYRSQRLTRAPLVRVFMQCRVRTKRWPAQHALQPPFNDRSGRLQLVHTTVC